jgi:HK97 family phage prohead protease
MTDRITRAFAGDIEVRSDGDGRTVVGIVAPFDQVARVSDGGPAYDEMFARGAFARSIAERGDRVKLLSQHQVHANPLGRAVLLREDAAGLYGEFVVSRTQAGDEALELIRDGALDAFSIGFRPINQRRDRGITVRTEVAIREASLVTIGAYSEARVLAVRNADRPSLTLARRRLELARLALTPKDTL